MNITADGITDVLTGTMYNRWCANCPDYDERAGDCPCGMDFGDGECVYAERYDEICALAAQIGEVLDRPPIDTKKDAADADADYRYEAWRDERAEDARNA